MDAGKLKRRVTIQRHTVGQDEIGQPVNAWADVATVYADIRHQSGLQSIVSDAPASTVRASIRIRYRTGINAGMRVVHSETIYSINAVLPDAAGREYIDLVCETVNAES
jgi:SPP1 family predicted phage head-tail adaptor